MKSGSHCVQTLKANSKWMIFKDEDKVIVELIEIGNCCAMVYIFKLIILRLKFEKVYNV